MSVCTIESKHTDINNNSNNNTKIICLGRQQTHKTFRFISHHKDFFH